MSSSTTLRMKSHEPLRRLPQQDNFGSLPDELICEDTPCIMPLLRQSGFVLPTNYVSVPSKEEGYIALRQQIAKGMEVTDQQDSGTKDWHHKAIRRHISKAKELVLFVGGMKCNLPASQYITYATQCAKIEKSSVGPVFPSLGCFFMTFFSGKSAYNAMKLFRLTRFGDVFPELSLLPYINVPSNIQPDKYNPLVVFINRKSGGGQGNQLYELMEQTLNPHQLVLIEKVGALPGLYTFRKLPRFRILICGGDGTVGWVLSHLEVVQRHLQCASPPIAVLPVGTGNDLARVLGFGSGWSGENVQGILAQIEDSQPVQLDRWNIVFDSSVEEQHKTTHSILTNAVPFQSNPFSPINIVMNVGGLNANKGDSLSPTRNKDKTNVKSLSVLYHNHSESNVESTSISDVNSTNPCTSVNENESKSLPNDIEHVNDDVENDSVADDVTNDDVTGEVTNDTDTGDITNDSDTGDVTSDDVVDDVTNRHVTDDSTVLLNNLEDANEQTADTSSDVDQEFSSDDLPMKADVDINESIELDPSVTETSLKSNVERSSSCSLSRNKKSQLSAKHRLVHIVSESDMEFGPFVGYEECNIDNDDLELLKDKLNLFRLNDDDESVGSTDSSLWGAEMRDGHTMNHSLKEVDIEESYSTLLTTSLAASQIATNKHSYRHHSDANLLEHKDKQEFQKQLSLPTVRSFTLNPEPQESAEEVKMLSMTNYLGIGIGAELTLAFHLAREGNPDKCTSRLRNKALYFKAGLKKMTTPSTNLSNVIDLEVDNVKIDIPSIRGLVFLNISSWGAGSHPWGSRVSKRFDPPSFGDGKLEVFGVGGVAHMSQIYSGIRTGFRIAQGEFIRVTLSAAVAVQIDGEPWMQPPGKIIITASTLQATMLKRNKKKSK